MSNESFITGTITVEIAGEEVELTHSKFFGMVDGRETYELSEYDHHKILAAIERRDTFIVDELVDTQLTLTEFTEARLDEDEWVALSSQVESPTPWMSKPRYDRDGEDINVYKGNGGQLFWGGQEEDSCTGDNTALFIARNDPARVLREIAAKREILEAHEGYECNLATGFNETYDDGTIYSSTLALESLAAVYSDHPDYNEDWK